MKDISNLRETMDQARDLVAAQRVVWIKQKIIKQVEFERFAAWLNHLFANALPVNYLTRLYLEYVCE